MYVDDFDIWPCEIVDCFVMLLVVLNARIIIPYGFIRIPVFVLLESQSLVMGGRCSCLHQETIS